MPHLPYEELPSLAEYDSAEHLVEKSFKTLDPKLKKGKGRRHLFWGLLSVFRESLRMMARFSAS